ncbi:hypothetical protein DES44_1319 [Roseateles depolymerans]|nr:hypothetical protein DES44_1319 [Roseateles depolymerans]
MNFQREAKQTTSFPKQTSATVPADSMKLPQLRLIWQTANDSNLATHLSTGGPSNKSVYGAHAEAAFQAELKAIGASEVNAAVGINGVPFRVLVSLDGSGDVMGTYSHPGQ